MADGIATGRTALLSLLRISPTCQQPRNDTLGELRLSPIPIRPFPLRCTALGAVCLAPGRWIALHNLTLGDVCQARGSNAVPGASGGGGKQFNHDNNDQEVNDTNIDPVSPYASGRLAEG